MARSSIIGVDAESQVGTRRLASCSSSSSSSSFSSGQDPNQGASLLSCTLVRRRNVLLERYASFGGAWWALPTKIVLDQTLFALYLNGAYCALLELMSRSSPRETWRRVKQAAWPSLVSSWRFWPAVHALTFSVVPVHLRVLWVDAVEIVWVAILSMAVTGSSDAVDEDVCVPAHCVVEDTEADQEQVQLLQDQQGEEEEEEDQQQQQLATISS